MKVYMEELRNVIAANLVELRTVRKITQYHLAQVLNYSDKAVSKWERAESIPDVATLKQIADYYGVSVDYLLTKEHNGAEHRAAAISNAIRRNRAIIALLADALVWLICTFAYVILGLTVGNNGAFAPWLLFIYAVPVSAIIFLIFNSLWGIKKYNYVIISVLVWGTLTSVYLSFLMLPPGRNIWLIFMIGIPAELIIFLWSRFRNSFLFFQRFQENQRKKREKRK